MTPQEHYDKAERLLDNPPGPLTDRRIAQAQVHATLALAGFIRDMPYDLHQMGIGRPA